VPPQERKIALFSCSLPFYLTHKHNNMTLIFPCRVFFIDFIVITRNYAVLTVEIEIYIQKLHPVRRNYDRNYAVLSVILEILPNRRAHIFNDTFNLLKGSGVVLSIGMSKLASFSRTPQLKFLNRLFKNALISTKFIPLGQKLTSSRCENS